MDNQHKHIKGYRDLSEKEVELMNAVKVKASEVGVLLDELFSTSGVDQRWISIAKTQLQQGFMAATRAIAQPTTF